MEPNKNGNHLKSICLKMKYKCSALFLLIVAFLLLKADHHFSNQEFNTPDLVLDIIILSNLIGFYVWFILVNIDDLKKKNALMQTEKLAVLGELSASLAHEINNPLTIICFSVKKIIREQFKNNSLTPEMILLNNKINGQIERITKIINSLKNYSRDTNNSDDFIQLNSITSIIQKSIELVEEKFSKRNITLEFTLPTDDILIECNEVQLEQVFINLLNNACDAVYLLPDKWCKVSIAYNGDNETIIITIQDSGTNFPKELKDKIFEPFFTTKEIGKGTGLGLSVSMNIIENHSGTIYVNTAEHNTTFIVSLKKIISFDTAIKNHLAWKTRLERYIQNPNNELSFQEVSNDKMCNLGKWLYEKESIYGHLSEYQLLKNSHREFHIAASNVIQLANEGRASFKNLSPGSIYDRSSTLTIENITRLKNKILV